MPPGIGYGRFGQMLQQQRKKPSTRERLSARFQGQAKKDEERGDVLEREAEDRLRGFDAEDAARRSARAQFDEFREDLGEDIQDLRGSQVGRGRLNSGFGFDEEDELVSEGIENLGRSLTQNALQAQGLNLSATSQLGAMGQGRTSRFLDVLASERDADFLEEEMRRRKKADKRGGLFSALGTVAKGVGGYIAGGPVGAGLALST